MSISEFVGIIWVLFSVYLFQAWPFMLAHASIASIILARPGYELWKEQLALTGWKRGVAGTTPGTLLLSQFVAEVREQGPRGTFVPMTDFSDRLDSHVEGLIGSLHSWINLFLLVGITGTFFALFDFSYSAAGQLANATPGSANFAAAGSSLAKSLTNGLAQAFPIGFFGLVLTIFGHVIAYWLEQRLNNSVTMATQEAMGARAEETRSVGQMITEGMAPLRNLDALLTNSIRPIMEEFCIRLEDTSNLFQHTLAPFATSSSMLNESVQVLVNATDRLLDGVNRIPESLASANQLVIESSTAVQSLVSNVARVGKNLDTAAVRVSAASVAMESLPSIIERSVSAELTGFANSAATNWQHTSDQFFEMATPARDSLREAAAKIETAAQRLEEVPVHIEQAIALQLEHVPERIMDEWQKSGAEFYKELTNSNAGFVIRMQDSLESTEKSLRGVLDHLERARLNLGDVIDQSVKAVYGDLKQSLEPDLERLETAIEKHYPTLAQNLKSAAEDSTTIARNQRSLVEQLEAVSKSLRQSVDSMERLDRDTRMTTEALGRAASQIEAAGRELSSAIAPRGPSLGPLPRNNGAKSKNRWFSNPFRRDGGN